MKTANALQKRFSVLILCYRHFEYLYPAIDSVLMQDYPNIELIVSDDGSENFPQEKIAAYIAAHKNGNISNTIIRQQKKNSGTVRHLNEAIKVCSGEYIVTLAGDDEFFDSRVLSKYTDGFAEAPADCYIEMAHTAMFDENMGELQEYYMVPAVQTAIAESKENTHRLFRMLIRYGACLPTTSTCYRKEFFAKYGDYDESYYLVEDYPMHVRLAEDGWIIHYCNFVAAKHRAGGISHGQSNTLSRSAYLYYTDDSNMIRNLILNKVDNLPRQEHRPRVREAKRNLMWTMRRLSKADGIVKIMKATLSYPSIAAEAILIWISVNLDGLRKKLPCVFLPIWMGIQLFSEMAELLIERSSAAMVSMLYILAAGCCGMWLILTLNAAIHAIKNIPRI